MDTIESLIRNYGYIAILVGIIFEGEVVLIVGGFLVRFGFLKLYLVILFAFLGAFICDQIYFYLGRRQGIKFLNKHPTWQAKFEKIHGLIRKYENLVIFGFRFIYGTRIVTPLTLGTSHITRKKFLILNLISALVWASFFGLIGYFIGHSLEMVVRNVKHIEMMLATGILVGIFLVWIIKLIRKKKI